MSFLDNLAAMLQGGGGNPAGYQSLQTPGDFSGSGADFSGGVAGPGGSAFGAPQAAAAGMPMGGSDTGGVPAQGGGLLGMLGNPATAAALQRMGAGMMNRGPTTLPMTGGMGAGINPMMMGGMRPPMQSTMGGAPPGAGSLQQPGMDFGSVLQALRARMTPGSGGGM
jgi:hypothetical protein